MSRIAWVPDFGNGPELYQPVEVPEPGEPGWPGADLPEGDPWAPTVNQLRAEIAADYAAKVDAIGLGAADFGVSDPEPEAETVTHDCPGPECHPYPTFGDDPARWGLLPQRLMTAAELEAEAWGPRGPSASFEEWLAEGRPEPEAEL